MSPSTSTVVVTTRITRRPARSQRPTDSSPPAPKPSSPLNPANANKKRKSPTSSETGGDVKRKKTENKPKKRVASSSKASSRASSRHSTTAPSPEPIYRTSRSRSTSLFPLDEIPVRSRQWVTFEDGTPGPRLWSSEAVVKRLMRSYISYFTNPRNPNDRSFEPHPSDYPYAELEYPNNGAVERFILLQPKDKDHYNPILCLERSLHTMIECYLTPAQQSLFGTIPSDALSEPGPKTPPPSPSPFRFLLDTSPVSSLSSLSDDSDLGLSPLTSVSSLPSENSSDVPSPPNKSTNLLRTLQRAIHCRDGPLFLHTISQINEILRRLKYPSLPHSQPRLDQNALMNNALKWEKTGLPKKVLMRLFEENYQRSVGPHVQSLKNYEAFSSTVYGELMPALVYDIIQHTGLNEDSVFVDMGSGVGNVVVQASLQSGCRSFGVELMPAPARIAERQWEQFKIRCRMWGLNVGEVELEKEDMLKSKKLMEYLPKADVVLVDNKVFEESLNEKIRPMFLDLKEGAIVVSLKPFSPVNARVTERNVDDMTGIFDVTERAYHSGCVSWGASGGMYYIHRVDREGYAMTKERFENSRTGRSTGRSRRHFPCP
ncbi:hypothetical protein ONZ45_g15007 [Pleurotus djamor]|nr:hypothetical protein ONZ45_g15007 [Pleurotus djamor]